MDSLFHRQRVTGNALADWARASFPMTIKRSHRWFARHCRSVVDPRGRWILWSHADGLPEDLMHVEDASHGDLSMRYVGVLHRAIERINTALFAANGEPIIVAPMRQHLANTFLFKVGAGNDLAHKVNGEFTDKPRPYFNGMCNGWLDLTGIDVRIYGKCRGVVLRFANGEVPQPSLTIGTHASLLANQPPAFYEERSMQFQTPPAAGAPTACVIPGLGVHNIAYRDTSGRLHELWRDAATRTGTSNLTELAGAPKAMGNPFAYANTRTNEEILLYRSSDGNVRSLYWSTGQVGTDDLSGYARAPQTAGDPVGYYIAASDTHHAMYRSSNGHLHDRSGPARIPSRTAAISRVPSRLLPPLAIRRRSSAGVARTSSSTAAATATSAASTGRTVLVARTTCLATPAPQRPPVTRSPTTPLTTIRNRSSTARTTGTSTNSSGRAWLRSAGWDISARAGAPAAAGDPVAYYSAGTNTKHVVYRSADGRLHDLRWVPGGETRRTSISPRSQGRLWPRMTPWRSPSKVPTRTTPPTAGRTAKSTRCAGNTTVVENRRYVARAPAPRVWIAVFFASPSLGCEKPVTPLRRTREAHHRDDRDGEHESCQPITRPVHVLARVGGETVLDGAGDRCSGS